ncbi:MULTISPECIES: TetR/AcrR family transcriptional regulator [Clostridium]|uniref:TetR/AcrR family transcriptional regulator n=1 Tax=Clostridium TaxID=1485 RepID=UPI000825A2CC|nr:MULTISPECIES: TetR/AcrR family transcriptional regulator [Clostridium]PJI09227.1 TetR/AcrR family transcriptional regulator [Clostridium sp. CT7]
MKKSELAKEKIIEVTIDLIQNANGEIHKITTRAIAKQAGIGVGLVNYHFESKNKLIEICVQRIISDVIRSFKPKINNELDSIDRIKKVTKMVADFLIQNPSVSKISILGDMNTPSTVDNTMQTVKGFLISMEDYNFPKEEKMLLSFALTSILQAVFLRKNITKESFGFDFNNKEERESFIDFMIDKLFGGK